MDTLIRICVLTSVRYYSVKFHYFQFGYSATYKKLSRSPIKGLLLITFWARGSGQMLRCLDVIAEKRFRANNPLHRCTLRAFPKSFSVPSFSKSLAFKRIYTHRELI